MATVIREERYIKSDVEANNNKFWVIQEMDDCSCFVRWGRVGDQGQSQVKSFPTQAKATAFFDSKCREKEGDRKGYQKQKTFEAGSTTVVTKPANGDLKDIALKQIETSSPVTKKLVEYLAKTNIHSILQATTMTYNAATGLFSTPCGIVTQDGIDDARKLLTQIGDFVAKRNLRDANYPKLLNQYLMLIPQKTGRKLDPETLYPDLASVQNQNSVLDSLEASLQIALKTPNKTVNKTADDAPKLFQVKLHYVEDGKEIDRIRKKYKSTLQNMHACAHLDVKVVYGVEIGGMQTAFERDGKKVGGLMELWHGTKAGNLLSIMKGGYVIPPSNAPHCTGRMFGNGVYFSDQSTKSLNYAYGYWGGGSRDNNCFMLLNQVAMGKYYVPSGASTSLPVKGYDSTWAQASKSGVMNNEMIVYRTSQINPTHLIEFSPGGK